MRASVARRRRAAAPTRPPPRSATKMLPSPTVGPLQVRAAEDTQDDLAVLDQRERDRVLPTPQETLGAVDRVERPPTAGRAPPASAHRPSARSVVRASRPGRISGELLRERRADGRWRAVPELARVLLAHDRVGRERLAEGEADEHLGAQVRHGHGRPVGLLRSRARPRTTPGPNDTAVPPTGPPRRATSRSRVTRRGFLPLAPQPLHRPRPPRRSRRVPPRASRSAGRWVPAARSTARMPRRSG